MPFASALAATTLSWQGVGAASYATVPASAQNQHVRNWCWLATTASVDAHYGGASTQCDLANQLRGKSICCSAPQSVDCNQPGSVEAGLQHVRRHDWTGVTGRTPAPLADIQNALAQGHPPACQLTLPNAIDHTVMLCAAGVDAAGTAVVRVGDPAALFNPTDVNWSQASGYRGGVTWTHVFWTKP